MPQYLGIFLLQHSAVVSGQGSRQFPAYTPKLSIADASLLELVDADIGELASDRVDDTGSPRLHNITSGRPPKDASLIRHNLVVVAGARFQPSLVEKPQAEGRGRHLFVGCPEVAAGDARGNKVAAGAVMAVICHCSVLFNDVVEDKVLLCIMDAVMRNSNDQEFVAYVVMCNKVAEVATPEGISVREVVG